jgi:hypothetical protein
MQVWQPEGWTRFDGGSEAVGPARDAVVQMYSKFHGSLALAGEMQQQQQQQHDSHDTGYCLGFTRRCSGALVRGVCRLLCVD